MTIILFIEYSLFVIFIYILTVCNYILGLFEEILDYKQE